MGLSPSSFMTLLDALLANFGKPIAARHATGLGLQYCARGRDGAIYQDGRDTTLSIPDLQSDRWELAIAAQCGPSLSSLFGDVLPAVTVDVQTLGALWGSRVEVVDRTKLSDLLRELPLAA